jgi:protein involved in polysaccharide export with SLBB domain
MRAAMILFALGAGLLPATPAAAQLHDAVAVEADVVRPGDAIRVRVFRAPSPEARIFEDFLDGGEHPVDERGFVVLPRIGRREVAGKAVHAVRDAISAELEKSYPNAIVETTVLRRVLVHGAVRRPGSYLLASYEATVGDALAKAEGIAPTGRTDQVRVLRGDRVISFRTGADTRLAAMPLQSGDELVVPQRSWITREPALSATILSSSVYLLVTLILVAQ